MAGETELAGKLGMKDSSPKKSNVAQVQTEGSRPAELPLRTERSVRNEPGEATLEAKT